MLVCLKMSEWKSVVVSCSLCLAVKRCLVGKGCKRCLAGNFEVAGGVSISERNRWNGSASWSLANPALVTKMKAAWAQSC